jgi:phosphoribosylamine--glycine ligase
LADITWADEYHRTDIGYRAIAREQQAQQQQ